MKSISDGDGNRLAALLAIALRKERSPLVEDVRITTKDGREVWVNAICKKIDYQGKPAGLVALREVTDRKRTEERLLASQERNRLLIENANEGIVVIQDEVLKFANPKTQELFGRTAQELVLKPMADIIHPEDRQTVMEQHFKRLGGDEVPHVHEFRIVDKAGNTKWVELNGVLLSWGERPADLCFVRDITKRKLAEEALHQSEERFRNLVENTSDWVWEVDTSWHLHLRWTKGARHARVRTFGSGGQDAVSLHDGSGIRPRRRHLRVLREGEEAVCLRGERVSAQGWAYGLRGEERGALLRC